MRNNSHGIRYSGIFSRLSSFFIDQIIIALIIGVLAGCYSWLSGSDSLFEENFSAFFLVSFLYYAIFTSGKWQATPGMKMVGLYLTDYNYERVDIITTALRYFLYLTNLVIASFIAILAAKLILAIMVCNNAQITEVLIMGPKNLVQKGLFEMTPQVSEDTISYILGVMLIVKLLVVAYPMFIIQKKQTLYDYMLKISVAKVTKSTR